MKCSYLDIDVTPSDSNIVLAGFNKRNGSREPFGIKESKINIVWLKGENDIVFVSFDTLYFPEFLAQSIYSFFEEKFGISASCIHLIATHTHSAPSIESNNFGLICNDYKDYLLNKVRCELLNIESYSFDCSLTYNIIDEVGGNYIGRRKELSLPFYKKIFMSPNKKQNIDNKIRVINIYDHNNKLKGLIYNFSCHPVFAKNLVLSSDFPGMINHYIKSELCQFGVFLQGWCGDIRPNKCNKVYNPFKIKDFLKTLFMGEVFSTLTPEHLKSFSKSLYRRIKPISVNNTNKIGEFIHHSFTMNLDSDNGNTKSFNVKLSLLNRLLLINIPAEVLCSYYNLLSNTFVDVDIMPLGYSENMVGYLPSSEESQKGGYEVCSAVNYGWDSNISTTSIRYFEKKLITEIDKLLKAGNEQ
jgi:hypothetical protein